MLMSRAKFATRFEQFQLWQNQRNAAEHVNMWQSENALSVLGSLDEHSPSRIMLHEPKTNTLVIQAS